MTTSPGFLSAHRRLLAVVGIVGVAVVGFLAFGVFGVHTLFIDDEVDEAGPVFASGAAASVEPTPTTTAAPTTTVPAESAADATATTAAPTTTAPTTTVPAAPIIVVEATGTFVDRSHPAAGTADVLGDGTGQRFLRFEDFATDNGPDLNVYLSAASPDAPAGEFDDDFVDLGDLKGNIGAQNYEIPLDVDLERYSTVVIWCVRFGVAFGVADLVVA